MCSTLEIWAYIWYNRITSYKGIKIIPFISKNKILNSQIQIVSMRYRSSNWLDITDPQQNVLMEPSKPRHCQLPLFSLRKTHILSRFHIYFLAQKVWDSMCFALPFLISVSLLSWSILCDLYFQILVKHPLPFPHLQAQMQSYSP